MKKFKKKLLECALIAVCIVSSIAGCIPVNAASGISPYTYEEPIIVFKGTYALSYQVTGSWMDVYVRGLASNSNNETITLEIYLQNRDVTKTYTFLTTGKTYEYKNIFLGFGGGSGVLFRFTGANPEITININMEVVSS